MPAPHEPSGPVCADGWPRFRGVQFCLFFFFFFLFLFFPHAEQLSLRECMHMSGMLSCQLGQAFLWKMPMPRIVLPPQKMEGCSLGCRAVCNLFMPLPLCI